MIYLDHAATSWPKPPEVAEALRRAAEVVIGNPGRAAHLAAVEAARMVFDVRQRLAQLLGTADSANVVFTRGATEGINLVLKGLLRPGQRVGVSPVEHNAVMRPLATLAAGRRIDVETLPADRFGRIDAAAAAAVHARRPLDLLAVAHVANVHGAVQDLDALRQALPAVPLLVDAAQSAGVLPLEVDRRGLDFVACSFHKGLLGPTGLGAVYLAPQHDVAPLLEGGTGSQSESFDQPAFRPDRYEAGTLNLHGLFAAQAALGVVERQGLLATHKRRCCRILLDGVRGQARLRLHSPDDGTALGVAFTVDGLAPEEAAARLDARGILCRAGLHCAPAAHRHLHTLPAGAVRLSPGWGNTEQEMEAVVAAIRDW